MKFIDLTGQRFGMLVFVARVKGRAWKLRCDCGKEHEADAGNVKAGKTTSCGCFNNRVKIPEQHGMTGTPEYTAWQAMITRATNPNFIGAKDYSARGITVCHAWRHSFTEFYAEVGPRPTPAHSIDRIKNDIGYVPGNVKWSTKTEQAQNRRSNNMLTVDGITKPVIEWAREKGIGRTTLDARVARGITGADLFAPLRPYGRKGA